MKMCFCVMNKLISVLKSKQVKQFIICLKLHPKQMFYSHRICFIVLVCCSVIIITFLWFVNIKSISVQPKNYDQRQHQAKKPNILFFLADDLGHNDVSWNNGNMIMPNLQKLADNGIILKNHYATSLCTPSRAALLTGYSPLRTGLPFGIIKHFDARGLYTRFKLMPQWLNDLGYKSYMVGKWHLGYCNQSYLPTRRGFEKFFGFWLGNMHYYSHNVPIGGHALINQEAPEYKFKGNYSQFVFADYASDLILNHSKIFQDTPFFLYFSSHSVHTPLTVPSRYTNLYPNISSKRRRIYSGMVTAMDDSVQTLIQALKNAKVYENTIFIFTSDNGASVHQGGNNFPYRGSKSTFWEGGHRTPAFIHAPALIKKKGSTYEGLVYINDWLPTLYHLAGGNTLDLGDVDGTNFWPALMSSDMKKVRKREDIVYSLGPYKNGRQVAALRIGDLKLIQGFAGFPDQVVDEEGHKSNDSDYFTRNHFKLEEVKGYKFNYSVYNLLKDPSEMKDIALELPTEFVKKMVKRLESYKAEMIDLNRRKIGSYQRRTSSFVTGWCKAQY